MKTSTEHRVAVLKAFEIAERIAKENANSVYGPAHLLKAILNRDFPLLKQLECRGIDVFYLLDWTDVRIEEMPKSTRLAHCTPHESIDTIMEEAEFVRLTMGLAETDLFCVLISLSTPGVGFSFDQLRTFPVSRAELLNEADLSQENPVAGTIISSSPLKMNSTFLAKYCIDKAAQLKTVKEKLAIAREWEINAITDTLCRHAKPNVLVVGDHGVGKTAIINTVIQNVVQGRVPACLQGVKVFELDLSALIAGASYKGEIEDRVKNIFQEVRQKGRAILIIEDISTLLGRPGGDGGMANILKNELRKGLTMIASSTVEEFTKTVAKDRCFAGMFEVKRIHEADDESHFRMIKRNVGDLARHHQLGVPDDALRESIRLAKRYLKERALPESAINLIDHTLSVLKTAGESFLLEKDWMRANVEDLRKNTKNLSPEQLLQESKWLLVDLNMKTFYLRALTCQMEKKETTAFIDHHEALNYLSDHIARLENIAQNKRTAIEPFDLALVTEVRTGIPASSLQEEERQRLTEMEDILRQRVVGQDHAVSVVADAIVESRSGLSKAGQPIGSFFFLGPTGTGKTELAKSLAAFLFQDENAILRFDMSEFKEEHSAALLYGAPPGYVGYEEGGLLVNKIRQKPYSVVLFDEIEKAHSSVFDVFLQIMDEGKLHDRLGKEGDFSNAIVLFTSNIGADAITASFAKGEVPSSSRLLAIMGQRFRPEFLGRVTEIVPFAPITRANAVKILDIHLKKELTDLAKAVNIEVEITQPVKEFLAARGYSEMYGARPLKSIIRNELRRPLAKKIIREEFGKGDVVKVVLNEGSITWVRVPA
ncbi:MAG TPA: ATP-dependent Clp protease ATP-binding subunit [Chryseolinea sp.]